MPGDRTRTSSQDQSTRRDGSRVRNRDAKTTQKISSTGNSSKDDDKKNKTDKYRSNSLGQRTVTKGRDESKSRKSIKHSQENIDKPIRTSRQSQQSVTSSNREKNKESSHRQSTEKNKEKHKESSHRQSDKNNVQSSKNADKNKRNASLKHSTPEKEKEKRRSNTNSKSDHEKERKLESRPHRSEDKDVKKTVNEHKSRSTVKEKEKESKKDSKISKEKTQKKQSLEHQKIVSKTKSFSVITSPEISTSESSTKLQLPQVESAGDSDYNYEDDFEDYESDFEDDDEEENETENEEEEEENSEAEMETEVKNRSIIQLNEDIKINSQSPEKSTSKKVHQQFTRSSSHYVKSDDRGNAKQKNWKQWSDENFDSPERKKPQFKTISRTFINFKSAQKQQERKFATSKIRKRGTELLEIITLDQITYDIFEMPPVNYDVYIRTFGRSNTKQVYVQTEYGEEEETQTDEIISKEKWTQIPPNDYLGVGGDLDVHNSNNTTWYLRTKTNAIHLNEFVQNAGQLVLNILEEELAEISQQKLSENFTNIAFSQGFVQLGCLPGHSDSPVTHLHFSETQTNLLLTVHAASTAQSTDSSLSDKGIICVWNINQPSEPDRILASSGQPSCCCFGPENTTVVIAGMVDGSVSLWDLREFATWHPQIILGEKEWTVRTPTYSTATILKDEGHHSCIVAIKTLPYTSSSHKSSSFLSKSQYGGNFHVMTLEDFSILSVWIVVEIAKYDFSTSDGDLGLAPWGKMKLVKSSSIQLCSLHGLNEVMKLGVRSFDFQIIPSNPSHMLITTDTGAVIHCTRFNSKISPRLYISDSDLLIEARCIDFSPHSLPVFLVGCDDGSIRLHNTRSEHPLITWTDTTKGKSVVQVKWSPSQPSIFYILDTDSYLYIWDLSHNISNPIQVCECSQSRISCFCFSCDSEISNRTSAGWSPHMAIAREDGTVEIHQLCKKFSTIVKSQYEEQRQCVLNL